MKNKHLGGESSRILARKAQSVADSGCLRGSQILANKASGDNVLQVLPIGNKARNRNAKSSLFLPMYRDNIYKIKLSMRNEIFNREWSFHSTSDSNTGLSAHCTQDAVEVGAALRCALDAVCLPFAGGVTLWHSRSGESGGCLPRGGKIPLATTSLAWLDHRGGERCNLM